MDFDLTADQQALVDGIDRLLSPYRLAPSGDGCSYVLDGGPIYALLSESGFLDLARQDGFGILDAVLMVEAVARLPYAVEMTGSALVAPFLDLSVLGPIAIAPRGFVGPVRFLPGASTLLLCDADGVMMVDLRDDPVTALDTPFAYPSARLPDRLDATAERVPGTCAARLRFAWQLGIAAEILGASQSAFDLTVEYVKTRKQFNRPIGAFQAIQHRLSEVVTLLEGLRLSLYEAASSDDHAAGALVCGHAQEIAARVIYETHQFHGAIGLTVEYPLHYWTYRLRMLVGEDGGADEHFALSSAAG